MEVRSTATQQFPQATPPPHRNHNADGELSENADCIWNNASQITSDSKDGLGWPLPPLPPFHPLPTLMRTTNYCACHDSSFVDGVFIPKGTAQSLTEKIAYPPTLAPIASQECDKGASDKQTLVMCDLAELAIKLCALSGFKVVISCATKQSLCDYETLRYLLTLNWRRRKRSH